MNRRARWIKVLSSYKNSRFTWKKDLIHMGDLEPPLQGSSDLVREGKQCNTKEESHGSPERRHGLMEDQQGLLDSPRPMLAQEWVAAVVHGSGSQHLGEALVGSPEAMGGPSQACKSVPIGLAGSLDEENSLLERYISETMENMREEYMHFETLEVCMEGTQIQMPGSPSYLKEQDCAVVVGHGKREVNDVTNVESTKPLKELQRSLVEKQGSIQNDNGTIVVRDRPVGKLDISLKNPSLDQEECCTRGRPFPMEVTPMSLKRHMGSDWSTEESPLSTVALPGLNCQEAARTEAEMLYLEPSVSAVLQDTDASEELENTLDEKKRKKRKRCRQRKKKKKLEAPDSAVINWLAELPFVNTDIGTLFEITSKSGKTANQKRKQKDKKKSKDDLKENKSRPNYFISLPITNPKIVQDIEMIQGALVKKEGRLSKAMVPHGSLHITLFVMQIASEDDIGKAIDALSGSKDAIQEILQGKRLVLPFEGISDFRNEVIFAKLAEEATASKLILVKETLEKIFKEKGIPVKDNKAFTPHLTIMKMSRSPKIRKQGLKKIDVKLYEDFKSHYFGEEAFTSLDFCSMVKKRQPSGYYHCESSITFGKTLGRKVTAKPAWQESIVLRVKLNQIKELLANPEIRAKMYKEVCASGARSRHVEHHSDSQPCE